MKLLYLADAPYIHTRRWVEHFAALGHDCEVISFRPAAIEGARVTYVDGFERLGKLRYLLQAQDDPSLLIPAAEVWHPHGRASALLHRNGFQPKEYLLAALGEALQRPMVACGSRAAPRPDTASTRSLGWAKPCGCRAAMSPTTSGSSR